MRRHGGTGARREGMRYKWHSLEDGALASCVVKAYQAGVLAPIDATLARFGLYAAE